MPRERDELIRQLRGQVTFLRRSGRLFDEGAEDEALRLAVSVRVLVHDTPSSTSLLKQLGVKEDLAFNDSYILPAEARVGDLLWQMDAGLAGLGVKRDGKPGYVASREMHPESVGSVAFPDWWDRIVIRDQQDAEFTRKGLVLAFANWDGGAHIDPELPAAYKALSRSNSLGWSAGIPYSPGDRAVESVPLESPVPANVRQIAWELEATLLEQLSEHLEFLPVI